MEATAEIYLKLENLQPIGAFKTRGAGFAMTQVSKDAAARGFVTASAGNMGQAVAWNASQMGVPCTVIVPESAPAAKLLAIERLGARVVKLTFDQWWQSLIDRRYPGVEGTFLHPFHDTNVMAGNGTIGLEILDDLPDVDTILVPWGGGGLAIGIAAAVQAESEHCHVMAVEVDSAAPLAASLAKGAPTTVDYRPTFVDGIGSKTVFPDMFELAQEFLGGSLTANVEETARAVRTLAERNHIIAEGAGAVATAIATSGRAGSGQIVCVVSGGNIDAHKLALILEGNIP